MTDIWQGNHKSTNREDTGMTQVTSAGIDPRVCRSQGKRLSTRPPRQLAELTMSWPPRWTSG